MNLAQIWEELEMGHAPSGTGRLRRRIYPGSACDVFLAVEKPTNFRIVELHADSDAMSDVGRMPTGRGVEARVLELDPALDQHGLELVLTDSGAADLFTALVTDVTSTAATESTKASAVQAFLDRLRRWQAFLEHHDEEGLSPEAQRGLYGELLVLRNYLLPAVGDDDAVASWTGPSHASHDFQLRGIAVEVKATASKHPQMLRIASERQLDDRGVSSLYLFHISIDIHRQSGETLPEMVDSLQGLIASGSAAVSFKDKLMSAGYLHSQRRLYEGVGLTLREVNLFRVSDEFPRIVETDLRAGVGDVHYSIAVDQVRPFSVEIGPLFASLDHLTS